MDNSDNIVQVVYNGERLTVARWDYDQHPAMVLLVDQKDQGQWARIDQTQEVAS